MRSQVASTLLLASTISAFQWPFNLPWFSSAQPDQLVLEAHEPEVPRTPRIAVIGAGPGGASATYWLSLAKARGNLSFEVDLYERSDYIGGRSTVVYPYGNTNYPHVEVGGSIYVPGNLNMMRATEEFQLERVQPGAGMHNEIGFWNGKDFVFRMETSGVGSWWGNFKAVWRYGIAAPRDLKAKVDTMLKTFMTLYDQDFGSFDTVSEAVTKLELGDAVAQSATEYLDSANIGTAYTREIVDAATRVNYGTDLEDIHGFGALVCMSASSKTYSTKDGNYKIFESFVNASDAHVFLRTPVTKLSKVQTGWELATSTKTTLYDAVVLAAPLQFSDIKFASALTTKIPEIPYVHLHVTLFTTTAKYPSSEYFGTAAPRTVLTTHDGARHGGPEPEFNSLSYLHPLQEGAEEWVVKIFSKKRISDTWLEKAFDGKVGWVYRKEWEAYPALKPRALDTLPSLNPDEGLYYVNAFEPFVSTMETETVASRNVVELLLRHHFKSSICPVSDKKTSDESTDEPRPTAPFVYGFDC
ncbi:FAD/NAD(P)-binding domain-containing protein [Auriculariales sp. MPI-PUGE-AT-0066]|nr:FAD/NAD(P)-binding domain-containing protein [Auriculariales sp. MPI-PUGE-AT-0066]